LETEKTKSLAKGPNKMSKKTGTGRKKLRGFILKKVFIITGEVSGDKHASGVARELLKLNPDIEIEAIGGKNLENTGVKLFHNHDKMGAMGLTPAVIFNHFVLGLKTLNYLKNEFKPDLVLLVDYGAFNLSMAKHLKKARIKTFYFIPPQIWASRKWRLKTVKKNVDKVLTIFPFEGKMYDSEGIDNVFVGHPLVKELPRKADRAEFFSRHSLDPDKKLISVFPGSRMFEIKYLFKIFLKAVKIIEKSRTDVQFVFSRASNLDDNSFNCGYKIIKGENHELLSASDALILASGTVALEAALYKTPMIIAYRGPLFFYIIYLLVRSIKKACLVNIITGKDIVPEFLMFDATAEKISKEILNLLDSEKSRMLQLTGFDETEKLLTTKHCVEEAAKVINEELTKKEG